MPATACPSRRFTGMPRAIPGPLRAKGTSPLETPDCRRRAVNGGPITRLQLAIDPPCHAPPALASAPFDGSPGSPSLRLRSPAPLHSSRMGLRYTGHARYVFRATEYLARPNRDVRTAPKSLPQSRATALPAVALAPDMKVSPGPFRHPCLRGRAPRRPAWQGRYPLP